MTIPHAGTRAEVLLNRARPRRLFARADKGVRKDADTPFTDRALAPGRPIKRTAGRLKPRGTDPAKPGGTGFDPRSCELFVLRLVTPF
jgi:hypothetical protein